MRHAPDRVRARITTTTAVIGSLSLGFSATPAAAAMPAADSPRPSLDARTAPVMRSTSTTPAVYTVRAGDTISGIALRFGLRTSDVLAWNTLTTSSIIRPGQQIVLHAGTSVAAPAATGGTSTYTVRSGDTLWAIATRAGMSVGALRVLNGLGETNIIQPGQVLTLAVDGARAAAASPSSASTASTAPGPPAGAAHTVARGETLWAIARGAGVSLPALLTANGLTEASIIYPGQVLTVPGAGTPASAPPQPAAASPAPAAPVTLDAEQTENARLIIQVGRGLGVPDRGIAIALATSMVESWIRNLDWGDRDSLGLFQQRPSTGWGTEAEVRDARRAAAAFFGGATDPNGARTRGLLDVPGWESMDFGAAAQAVQISAYPERYAPWEQQAYAWLAALG